MKREQLGNLLPGGKMRPNFIHGLRCTKSQEHPVENLTEVTFIKTKL